MTADRPSKIISAIRALLDGRNRGTSRGQWKRGRLAVDYSVTVGELEDAGTTGLTAPSSGSLAIAMRPRTDGLLVHVDLEPVEAEALSVAVDRRDRTLLVSEGGVELARVPLEGGEWTVEATSLNNGILAVTLNHE